MSELKYSVGSTFDDWTVIAVEHFPGEPRKNRYTCRCIFGKERTTSYGGMVKWKPNCGCGKLRALTESLIGKRFGNWQVISYETERRGNGGYRLFLCRCQCGIEKYKCLDELKSGKTLVDV